MTKPTTMLTERTANYSIYRDPSCFGPRAVQTKHLIAEPAGDGWWAVYERRGQSRTRSVGVYPHSLIGLRHRRVTRADLAAVEATPRVQSGIAKVALPALGLEPDVVNGVVNPAIPRPSACVVAPFLPVE